MVTTGRPQPAHKGHFAQVGEPARVADEVRCDILQLVDFLPPDRLVLIKCYRFESRVTRDRIAQPTRVCVVVVHVCGGGVGALHLRLADGLVVSPAVA